MSKTDILAKLKAALADPKTTLAAIVLLISQMCKLFGFPVAPEVFDSVSIVAGAVIAIYHGGIGELSTSITGVLSAAFFLLQTWHIIVLNAQQQAAALTVIGSILGFFGFSQQESGKPATALTPAATKFPVPTGTETPTV